LFRFAALFVCVFSTVPCAKTFPVHPTIAGHHIVLYRNAEFEKNVPPDIYSPFGRNAVEEVIGATTVLLS
jgi:hypothetical protein